MTDFGVGARCQTKFVKSFFDSLAFIFLRQTVGQAQVCREHEILSYRQRPHHHVILHVENSVQQ